METATVLLEAYGYWLLLAVGFAEFGGLPIASVPVLIVAGAASAQGALSLPGAAITAAAGGLLADAGWYWLSRWRGQRLVDTVCNLTSNPRSCVLAVSDRLKKVGPALVLPSKFLPGTGNLAAASAGLAGMRPGVFLASDAAALALWATAYVSLGFVLSGQVAFAVDWVAGFAGVTAAVSAALILGALAWRFVRARMHRGPHRRVDGTPPAALTSPARTWPASEEAHAGSRGRIQHEAGGRRWRDHRRRGRERRGRRGGRRARLDYHRARDLLARLRGIPHDLASRR